MGHRSIILLFSAFFAVAASNVYALGLGKIKLESSLNQTLQAEIELFEVRDLVQQEILVNVASREDFERVGVDKVYFLSDLKFDVKLTGPGSPKIVVTSTKLVREPFLNFIVEVKWPSGKLLREYTLLLDLPAFTDRAAPAVQPTAGASEPRYSAPAASSSDSEYNPRSAFEGGRSRPSAAPVSPSYTGDTYRVRSNDTLWEIAASVRPDREVSIHQTMIAIQRVNPDAFISSNINLLKEGRVLRIPDRDQMAQLNRSQAVREVAQQNSLWSGGAATNTDAELSNASSGSGSRSTDDSSEGRLKLASPDDVYESSEGRARGGSASVSTEALENELSATLEQMDKTSRENRELRSKVESLEDQISTMEKMLEVTNESLRAQELAAIKLAQERDAAASGGDSVEGETLMPGDENTGSAYSETESSAEVEATPVVTPEPTAVPTVAATPSPVATPLPASKRVVSSPEVQEKGIIDIILDNILYIVGGIVVIGAAAVFFIRRSSADDEDEFDEFMDDQDLAPVAPSVSASSEPDENELDLGGFTDSASAQDEALDNELDLDIDMDEEDDADPEAQTEDVVAEADIYIAYGKFDQAEEMLKRAITKEPNDEDARLKLMEVYASQGDGDSFDEHYTKLRAFASPSVLERADSLRQNIPNIGEFDEVKHFGGSSSSSQSLDSDDTTRIQYPDSSKDDDDLDLDFDMDLPDDSASPSASDDGSDFDLDGFDSPTDFGDLGLDSDAESSADDLSSLEDDLDSMDTEIDLSVSFDKPTAGSQASSGSEDDLGDFDFPDGDLDFDLEGGLDDLDPPKPTGDTTVNQALNDEYLEQNRSKDAGMSAADDLSGDDELDLSALDDELDALTAGLDDDDLDLGAASAGLDFDDFDDDLGLGASGGTSASASQSQPPAASSSSSDDFELPDIDENDSGDDDLDFLSDSDETATKLDLARAYIDMGDQEGARDIIKEVLSEGNAQQKSEAESLLARIEA